MLQIDSVLLNSHELWDLSRDPRDFFFILQKCNKFTLQNRTSLGTVTFRIPCHLKNQICVWKPKSLLFSQFVAADMAAAAAPAAATAAAPAEAQPPTIRMAQLRHNTSFPSSFSSTKHASDGGGGCQVRGALI